MVNTSSKHLSSQNGIDNPMPPFVLETNDFERTSLLSPYPHAYMRDVVLSSYRRIDEFVAGSPGVTARLRTLQRVAPRDAAANGAGAVHLLPYRRAYVLGETARIHAVVQRRKFVADAT